MTETEIIKNVTTITARKETREIINAFLSCVREALKANVNSAEVDKSQ